MKQQIELTASERIEEIPEAHEVIAYLAYALDDVRVLSPKALSFLEVAIAQVIEDTSAGQCMILDRPQRLS